MLYLIIANVLISLETVAKIVNQDQAHEKSIQLLRRREYTYLGGLWDWDYAVL